MVMIVSAFGLLTFAVALATMPYFDARTTRQAVSRWKRGHPRGALLLNVLEFLDPAICWHIAPQIGASATRSVTDMPRTELCGIGAAIPLGPPGAKRALITRLIWRRYLPIDHRGHFLTSQSRLSIATHLA
jgi:hypothetical protein